MSSILEPQPVLPPFAALIEDAEIERAKTYGRAAKSSSTRREYARDWADFERYCRSRNLAALSAEPQTIARYVATLAGVLTIATIRRRIVAISQVHQERGLETPTAHKIVREVLPGIANTHGSAVRQKEALTLESVARGTADVAVRPQRAQSEARSGAAAARFRRRLPAL